MRFDPAADPWGAAMLAAAGLWLLSLLVVLAAMLARTSRRTGGYLMLVSLLAFLVAAVGGTWERIQRAEEPVAVAPPAPPDETVTNVPAESAGVVSDGTRAEGGGDGSGAAGEGSTGGPATGDPSTGGAETTSPASGATGDAATGDAATGDAATGDAATGDATTGDAAGSTGEPDPDTGGDTDGSGQPEPAEPEPSLRDEPVVPEDLPRVDPLPTEPGARERAIRDILDDAKRAAGGGERCGNLQRVATAWARLRMVPVTRKAKSVAADLEQCRRRLLYSISQRRLGEMIDERDAWFEKLPTKLRKQHGLIVQAAVSAVRTSACASAIASSMPHAPTP